MGDIRIPGLPIHDGSVAAGRGGSHAFGLAGAVELSRTLGTLPRHLVVIAVEAATFAPRPPSPQVEAALPAALVAVAVGMGAAVGPDGTLAARRRLRIGPLPDSGAHAA